MRTVIGLDWHPEAARERLALPARERVALQNAVAKLKADPLLGHPHTSEVRGARSLRELRPRAGRSVTRALYRRIGDVLVIGAVGPEAEVDRRGYDRAVRLAEQRLDQYEPERRHQL